MVVHKDYKAPTFENDIAILELEDPIERQPHVVPICMPQDDTQKFLGKMGIVTGWGRLEYGEFRRKARLFIAGLISILYHMIHVGKFDQENIGWHNYSYKSVKIRNGVKK